METALRDLFEVERHRNLRDLICGRDASPYLTINDVRDRGWRPDQTPRVPLLHVDQDVILFDVVGRTPVNRR